MLKLRIVTALIALAVLLLVVFAAPPIVVEVAIGLLTIAGAWEWSGLLGLRSGTLRWVYVTVIGACAAGLYFFGADLTQALLLVALGWWLAALLWVSPPNITWAMRPSWSVRA